MYCSKCGKPLSTGAQFCQNCGAVVTEGGGSGGSAWNWQPTSRPDPAPAQQSWNTGGDAGGLTSYCQRCDKPVPEGVTFCSACSSVVRGGAVAGYGQAQAIRRPRGVLENAGFWMRFIALIVDQICWYIFAFCVGAVIGLFIGIKAGMTGSELPAWMQEGSGARAPVELVLLMLVLWLLILPAFESSSLQGTPGKLVLGLKVTDLTGGRVSYGQALVRTAGKLLSSVLLIGFIMAAFTEHKQGLHDMMAGTLVVRK